MKKITVSIDGMHCEKCSERISKAIMNVENVKKVKTSLGDKQSVIIAGDEIDEAAIKSAVEDLEFTVTSVSSEPYKKGLFFFKK